MIYTVYIHTCPNGKVYIGITTKSIEARSGSSGTEYRDNKEFLHDISLYGWDNFKHDILLETEDESEACRCEHDMIEKFNSRDPDHGYNKYPGGQNASIRSDVKEKISKGHINSNKVHNRAWNKGLTKYDHPGILRGSLALSKPMTDNHKISLSKSMKRKYEEGYSPIWVNNGQCEKLIDSSKQELPEGFTLGRLEVDSVYVHDPITDQEIKISRDKLQSYQDKGWILGPSKHRGENIRKSIQKYYWIYEDKRYENSEQLASYLREHGYPKIVSSTITSLYNKGFSTSKSYSFLDGKILRLEVE